MSDDKELQIGTRVIGESTKITLTVKVAIWILGGFLGLLSLLFTWFYFNSSSERAQLKKDMEASKKEVRLEIREDLKSFKNDILVIVNPMNQNILEIVKEQGEIKGDVKLIIEKQLGIRTAINNVNEVTPNRANAPLGPSN